MFRFKTSGRMKDYEGALAVGNFGVSTLKNLGAVNYPYIFVGDHTLEYRIEFNFNFIAALRRVLSGITGDYRMSSEEKQLYLDYVNWMSDELVATGKLAIVLEELDDWLVDVIANTPQPRMLRRYSQTNQWN